MRLHTFPRPPRALWLALFVVAVVAVVLVVTAAGGGIARGRGTPVPVGTAAGSFAVHSRLIAGLADGAAGDGGASTGPQLDRIRKNSGARWLRDAFWWYRIEPRAGHFDFRYYDHYMLAVGRRHMRVVPQLVGAPRWAAPSFWAVPADPRAFAGFVAQLMRRYGVGGSFWSAHPRLKRSAVTAVELLNEPYFVNGNAGHYDPARYARLVRATAITTRRLRHHVRLLLEADMATHQYKSGFRWWVDSLYRAMPSLSRYFDGVAMHDYGADVTHLTPIRYGQPYPNFGRMRRIEDVRAQFVRHHAADKAFWIMETGFTTCHVHNIDCVSKAAQAADLRTLLGYIRGRYRRWVQAVFVYRYQDSNRGRGVFDSYGLMRWNGTPKPAMSVFKALARTSG